MTYLGVAIAFLAALAGVFGVCGGTSDCVGDPTGVPTAVDFLLFVGVLAVSTL